jgi:hypothetical protein
MMISLIAYTFIKGSAANDIVCGLSLYIDPALIYIIAPVRMVVELIQSKRVISISLVQSIVTWVSISGIILFVFSGDYQSDIRNYLNILSMKDHSENIGLFWYLFVELFK